MVQALSTGTRTSARCHLVGGGIANLAAAAYLVRDGKVPGHRIHVLEAERPGGSLDASGSAEQGYSMRGSRMFGPAYVHLYDLLDGIPSLDDPAKSALQDLFEFWQAAPWLDRARLVRGGKAAELKPWGLRNRDRADLVKLMLQSESALDGARIDERFEAPFFDSNFWLMWCSMFGFEPWHGAAELRRYLLRFLRLFPELETLGIIQSTRYNAHDSMVRPLVRWLESQGVHFELGVEVTDLDFEVRDGGKAVRALQVLRRGEAGTVPVAPDDVVIVTLGSMAADSHPGSMTAPPLLAVNPDRGSWGLWRRLAAKDSAFGRPEVFCGDVERTKWVTFTVTDRDERFFAHMQRLSDAPAGRGGLVTIADSSWLLTFHLFHPPAYAGPGTGRHVWWGYGLYPDRPGDFVPRTMPQCTGRDILVELYTHLGLQDELDTLVGSANCIPCLLPYTTSQFMPRRPGDRPAVVPEGARNFAFVGQYCEIPHDTVYTVEYSVHAARLAVSTLLGLPQDWAPTYEGLEHPNALVGALQRILAG